VLVFVIEDSVVYGIIYFLLTGGPDKSFFLPVQNEFRKVRYPQKAALQGRDCKYAAGGIFLRMGFHYDNSVSI
jgi:hypothetical protein